ncbi:MAG: biotin transporter BioY [Gudongella sp.]|jgi:biotin transport system substrate-specific component|nr:biotin transporter BioY [Gudongella sp.]
MKTKDLTAISLFTALSAVSSFISIPVGPVPVTLQTLVVLLSGFILGPKKAAISQIAYILLGLSGLPIFAGFTGGIYSFLKPSFGFAIGFVAGAFVSGAVVKVKRNLLGFFFGSLAGTISIYAFGLPYMAFILNSVMNSGMSASKIFQIGMLIFIPGDILKLVIASLTGFRLSKIWR